MAPGPRVAGEEDLASNFGVGPYPAHPAICLLTTSTPSKLQAKQSGCHRQAADSPTHAPIFAPVAEAE